MDIKISFSLYPFLYLLRIPCFSALLFLEVLFIQPSYDPVEPVSLQREPPLKVDRTPSSSGIDNKLGNPLKSSWLTNILLFFFSGRFLIFSNCQGSRLAPLKVCNFVRASPRTIFENDSDKLDYDRSWILKKFRKLEWNEVKIWLEDRAFLCYFHNINTRVKFKSGK